MYPLQLFFGLKMWERQQATHKEKGSQAPRYDKLFFNKKGRHTGRQAYRKWLPYSIGLQPEATTFGHKTYTVARCHH